MRTAEAVEAQRQLTDRDHDLLHLLADHQVLTTEQIARTLFASENVARRRLVLLTRRGVLARFRNCRRPGSESWRYTLGPLGALVHAAAVGATTLPTPTKIHERALRLARSPRLTHLLGVNDVFTRLAEHARTTPGHALLEWVSERDATQACAQVVRPDGYGRWRENGREVGFFLEYDTGTEKAATVVGKITGYQELADAGINKPVLFVFPGHRREQHFHNAVRETVPDALRRLSIATTVAGLLAHADPAGSAWLPAAARARCDLIDIPT